MGPKLLIALLSLVVSTISVPTEVQIEGRALNCKVVDAVINYFTRYTAQASSFCTAYLQTTTTIAVTVPRATKTISDKLHLLSLCLLSSTFKRRDEAALPCQFGSVAIES